VIDIVVTAEDGVTEKTYTITVNRAIFSDVSPVHPFFEEIEQLVALGITTGWPDGTFRPTLPVTRQAMAAFLFRAFDLETPDISEPTFTDVPEGHPFFEEIEALAASGITTGWPDGTFRPSNSVSRQAMAAFLYRALGLIDLGVTIPTFSDVPTDHPYFKEIEALAATGVTTGWPDGTFRPDLSVTRQAMAAFLIRALELYSQ
jgi:putative N-acetylmannosamine-6-phosphate epimerase